MLRDTKPVSPLSTGNCERPSCIIGDSLPKMVDCRTKGRIIREPLDS